MISAMDETRKPAGEWAAIGTLGVDPAGSDGRGSPLSAPQTPRAGPRPNAAGPSQARPHFLAELLNHPAGSHDTAGVRRWSSGPPSAHRRIERRRHAGHGSSIPREDGRPRRDKRRVLGGERGWRNIRLGRSPGPCLVRRNQARGGLIGSVERTGGVPRLRHPAGCARRPPVPPSPARWCARAGDRGWVVRRRSGPT